MRRKSAIAARQEGAAASQIRQSGDLLERCLNQALDVRVLVLFDAQKTAAVILYDRSRLFVYLRHGGRPYAFRRSLCRKELPNHLKRCG